MRLIATGRHLRFDIVGYHHARYGGGKPMTRVMRVSIGVEAARASQGAALCPDDSAGTRTIAKAQGQKVVDSQILMQMLNVSHIKT